MSLHFPLTFLTEALPWCCDLTFIFPRKFEPVADGIAQGRRGLSGTNLYVDGVIHYTVQSVFTDMLKQTSCPLRI